MSVQKRRLDKGWSQEHLAQLSGLSLRTIQRVESGKRAGNDSLNALAAAFNIDIAVLREEQTMATRTTAPKAAPQSSTVGDKTAALDKADEYGQHKTAFLMNLAAFFVIMPLLYWLNTQLSPDTQWVHVVAAAWGAAFVLHGLVILVMRRSHDGSQRSG